MVSSEFLENFQKKWNKMVSSDEGDKIKKLLAIDGKTQRGNGGKNQKANHIVSAVDGRELSLASGCDIPGRWEPYIRKTGILQFEYYEEAVTKHIKTDRSRKQGFKSEEKAFCNRYKSRKASGTDYEFVKFYPDIRVWLDNTFMRLSCVFAAVFLTFSRTYCTIIFNIISVAVRRKTIQKRSDIFWTQRTAYML